MNRLNGLKLAVPACLIVAALAIVHAYCDNRIHAGIVDDESDGFVIHGEAHD